jgi:hypothetical protein
MIRYPKLVLGTLLTWMVLALFLCGCDLKRRLCVRHGGGPGVALWFVLFFLLGCATRKVFTHALPAVASSQQLAARSCR